MNRPTFFERVRPIFGGKLTAAQVGGIEILLTASEGLPVSHRAYLLGTAFHETAETMQPVRETLAKTDADAIRRLEQAWQAEKLKWVKTPYWRKDAKGQSWFGRGYVQLTHKANYQKAGKAMGIDLVSDPSAALSPMVAARILVQGCSEGWFTGKKLSDYLPGDYINARRVVNGTDRVAEIAGYARRFEAALVASADGAPSKAEPKFIPTPKKAPEPSLMGGVVAGIAALIAAAVAKWQGIW